MGAAVAERHEQVEYSRVSAIAGQVMLVHKLDMVSQSQLQLACASVLLQHACDKLVPCLEGNTPNKVSESSRHALSSPSSPSEPYWHVAIECHKVLTPDCGGAGDLHTV